LLNDLRINPLSRYYSSYPHVYHHYYGDSSSDPDLHERLMPWKHGRTKTPTRDENDADAPQD